MKSILSVDARQHLVSLIPEICVRNQFDDVASELVVHESLDDNRSVDGSNEETIKTIEIPQQFSQRHKMLFQKTR